MPTDEEFAAQRDEWQLSPDGELRHGRALVQRVRTVDGRPAVLKRGEPTGWHAGQVPALKAWRAEGVAEVLRAKPAAGALLLEPLQPSWLWGEDAFTAVAGLWRRLHRPAPAALPRLDDLLAPELDRLAARGRDLGVPPRLAEQAVVTGRRLIAEAPDPVMLHGALRQVHLMSRGDEPVAIAPLGLAGDPHAEAAAAFDDAPSQAPAIQEHFWALVDALDAAGVRVDERRLRDLTVVLSVARAARPGAHDGPGTTHLVTVAKAVGALQMGQTW